MKTRTTYAVKLEETNGNIRMWEDFQDRQEAVGFFCDYPLVSEYRKDCRTAGCELNDRKLSLVEQFEQFDDDTEEWEYIDEGDTVAEAGTDDNGASDECYLVTARADIDWDGSFYETLGQARAAVENGLDSGDIYRHWNGGEEFEPVK